MIKNLFIMKIKNNFSKIFLIIIFITMWAAIGTDFNTFKLGFAKTNITTLIDSFRFGFPYLLFFIYLIIYQKINFFTENRFLNLIIICLLANFLIQSISLLIVGNNAHYLHFFFLIIFSFITLIDAYNANHEKKFVTVTAIILIIYCVIFSGIAIHEFLYEPSKLNLYGLITNIDNYWDIIKYNSPRSSGLSRVALIVSVPCILIILTSDKSRALICLLYYFNTNIIILTQSRINTFFFFLFLNIIFYYCILLKKNFLEIVKKIILIIIFPIVIYGATINLKKIIINFDNSLANKNFIEKLIHADKKYTDLSLIRETSVASPVTSGRLEDWKEIIQKNSNIIFGNGLMGDRFLISQSASNIFIYNYASGGVFSVIIFILLILRSIFICIKLLIIYKIIPDKNNLLIMSSIFIQSYLIFRGVAESTFAVFGIDFLIFFTLYFFSENYYLKISILNKQEYTKNKY